MSSEEHPSKGVLFISGNGDSEKARKLLSEKAIPFKEVKDTENERNTPVLITEKGNFEGIEDIQTYCETLEND